MEWPIPIRLTVLCKFLVGNSDILNDCISTNTESLLNESWLNPYIRAFSGFCNKLQQTCWRKTTEVDSFSYLEARSLKSRCWHGHTPGGSLGEPSQGTELDNSRSENKAALPPQ